MLKLPGQVEGGTLTLCPCSLAPAAPIPICGAGFGGNPGTQPGQGAGVHAPTAWYSCDHTSAELSLGMPREVSSSKG